ncbi:MAG TPA: hypothetical protein VMI75_32150 [Polyangiaceae bacterium]|nr:hypothetical protein [Polyangiaceae bacterium]
MSEANVRHHWRQRAERTKAHRSVTLMVLSFGVRQRGLADTRKSLLGNRQLVVRLGRVGKNLLDDDNLRGAFKAVRDGIADALLLKDNDPRIAWEYSDARGPSYECRIEIALA